MDDFEQHGEEQHVETSGTESAPVEVPEDDTAPQGDEPVGGHRVHAEEDEAPVGRARWTEDPDADETPDASEQGGGLLVGTATEQAPGVGVGGSGDHPAPAVMRDPDTGELHSAGRPPSGFGAPETAPAGDTTDLTDENHALDPEAAEALGREHEPDQIETERPDLGTE